jgi:hypothetical protein
VDGGLPGDAERARQLENLKALSSSRLPVDQVRHGIVCCDEADGWRFDDVDWESKDGHYRVRLYGEWVPVPDATVVTEPNRFGPAVVWPYLDTDGTTQVRCFLPGAGG